MIKSFIILAVAFVLATPTIAFGANYAYVTENGEVRTVVADSAENALKVAPNIHRNSGVLLLDSPEDNRVL